MSAKALQVRVQARIAATKGRVALRMSNIHFAIAVAYLRGTIGGKRGSVDAEVQITRGQAPKHQWLFAMSAIYSANDLPSLEGRTILAHLSRSRFRP